MSIEGQGPFFTIYFFQVLYVLCFTWPRYQVSVYNTIGPLVYYCNEVNCQILAFVTLHDGHKRQKTIKHHLNTKSAY